MKQFFKKTIKKHIKALEGEREKSIKLLKVYPEDSFSVAFLYFGLKWSDFKISIWETLMGS